MCLVMRPRERCLLGNEALGPLQRVASVENPEMNLPRNRAVLQDQGGGVQGAGVSATVSIYGIFGAGYSLSGLPRLRASVAGGWAGRCH